MDKLNDKILNNRRDIVEHLLTLCTEAQQDLFHRMYKKPVPESMLEQAILQLENTINKHDVIDQVIAPQWYSVLDEFKKTDEFKDSTVNDFPFNFIKFIQKNYYPPIKK